MPGAELDDLGVCDGVELVRPRAPLRDRRAELRFGLSAGQEGHRHLVSSFIDESDRIGRHLHGDRQRASGRLGAHALAEVPDLGIVERVPAGERDDAVDDLELRDALPIGRRDRVDEDHACDAVGPRVGGAPRDVAPAAMADDHDLPVEGIDLCHDRVDPVGDADLRRLRRRYADSRQGQGVDGMARSLERGSHVVP